MSNNECGTGERGETLGLGDDVGVGQVALGTGEREVHADAEGGKHERVGDVVAVADEGQLEALEGAEVFAQRLHVGEGLAGVVGVGEGVDDGDTGPFRQLFDGGLGEDAGDDAMDPAVEIAGDILERLADADGALAKDRRAAEFADGDSKVTRVRREGFSKRRAMDLPSREWA